MARIDGANPLFIWKVSHGDLGGQRGVPRGYHERLLRHHKVAVYSTTRKGQGEAFRRQMKRHDIFYLCHANEIILLGEIISGEVERGRGNLDGWLLRPYRILRRLTATDTRYSGKRFGWTPNYDSTCKLVPLEEHAGFEKRILKPFFGMKLEELLGRRRGGLGGRRTIPGPNENSAPKPPPAGKKAGIESDPRIKKAIEDHAMRLAEEYFRHAGYEVTTKGKPYDLRCRKGMRLKYVEVKGTTTKGESIRLTKNEVGFARGNRKRMALYVRHSVRVKGRKNPTAFGGKARRLDPWDIYEGKLQATEFEYVLPGFR